MKLLVPGLASAWEGQLLAASIPFHELSRWSVPFIEILLGVMLLLGTFARVAVVVVIGIMLVASYVHVVVQDPTLFSPSAQRADYPSRRDYIECVPAVEGGRRMELQSPSDTGAL